ncbi:carbohydrate kinase family protein [Fodinisporobacter ferrooxydans]|uniref:Carbohydrate kinase family protein n=1 Tax=Fodinisporobacter ferrooxydans TaxID=2901836 RepID=A0ABY4CQY3_9BACL|nr:carbohydrate kinase family protein [Alicyclobacillaceae bacterium MYW30-H2]
MADGRGPKVLLAGHNSLDIIPDLSSLAAGFAAFRPGSLIHTQGVRFATGGAVLNTGLALHRLGMRVRLLIKVGRDPFGQILQTLITDQLNIATECGQTELMLVEEEAAGTSFTLVLSPKNADRMFVGYSGTNQTFSASDVKEDDLEDVALFHFGYPPLLEKMYSDGGKALAALFAHVRRRGIVTSLDMCMPDVQGESSRVDWPSFLANVLPHVDVFMPSMEEIMFMLDRERFDAIKSSGREFIASITERDLVSIGQALVDMGARIVGLKLGDYGLYMRTGSCHSDNAGDIVRPRWWKSLCRMDWSDRELYIPCFSVLVTGTTGAGDCTIAGFLSGMLHELTIETCMTHAVAVGACSVEQVDATSGVPSWKDVQDRIKQGWPMLESGIPLKDWKQHDGVYYGPRDRNRVHG